MTPVFCCGFECGVLGANGQHWSNVNAGTINTSIKHAGNRSLRINPTADIAAVNIVSTMASALTTVTVVKFYIYFASLPGADASMLVLTLGVHTVGVIFKQSDSKLYTAIDHTTSSASGVSVTTGQWYRIDYKINSVSNPWSQNLQVDGSAVSSTNAFASVAPTVLSLGHGAGSNQTYDVYVDDFSISQTDGDYPLGAGYSTPFIPTSDGTHNVAGANDFERSATGTDIDNTTTTAYQLIDDVPLKSGSITEYINLIAPPNATDYVEVVFGPAPGISAAPSAPRAVECIIAKAKGTGTGTNNLRVALNDNGTTNDIFNGDTTVASPTASYARKHYAAGPAGAWTLSAGAGNFNNIRMRCFTSDAAPDPWWASAMIEAEFAGDPPVVSAFTPRLMLMGVG